MSTPYCRQMDTRPSTTWRVHGTCACGTPCHEQPHDEVPEAPDTVLTHSAMAWRHKHAHTF
jgi:hypothetical protein